MGKKNKNSKNKAKKKNTETKKVNSELKRAVQKSTSVDDEQIKEKEFRQQLEQDLNTTILAMAQDPTNAQNYHNLARLYALDEKYDKVTSVYESLLNIHPDDSLALLNLGSIWFFQKEYKKALIYYQKAMDVDPENYLVYYNLGNTYSEMKNFSKALKFYNRSIDFYSNNTEVYNAIALLYNDFEVYMTVKEFAQDYGLKEKTVQRYCKNKKIVAQKEGKKWFIPEDSIPPMTNERIRLLLLSFLAYKANPVAKLDFSLAYCSERTIPFVFKYLSDNQFINGFDINDANKSFINSNITRRFYC